MQPEAVIFDLDDTLYAERDYVHSGLCAVARWLEPRVGIGAATVESEMVALFESGLRHNLFDEWFAHRNLEPNGQIARMVGIYRMHRPDIALFPEVTGLIARLKKVSRTGIVTDGYLISQQKKVVALGVAEQVDGVVFTDAFGKAAWKPARFGFDVMVRRLGVRAERSVYVADNPTKDFLGARRAGLSSIRVRRRGGIYEMAEPAGPDGAPDREIAGLDALESSLADL